jgi:hypothetical protein
MITVYTFSYENGEYTGSRMLDPSDGDPKSPGSFFIPGNATIEPPPRCSEGLKPVWRKGRWEVWELVEEPDPPSTEDYWPI